MVCFYKWLLMNLRFKIKRFFFEDWTETDKGLILRGITFVLKIRLVSSNLDIVFLIKFGWVRVDLLFFEKLGGGVEWKGIRYFLLMIFKINWLVLIEC